jgi:hypothetical protein
MNHELIRIGSDVFVNKSELYKTGGFDALFNHNYEFVYVPDFGSWQPVNGTWQGIFGLLENDHHID